MEHRKVPRLFEDPFDYYAMGITTAILIVIAVLHWFNIM